CNVSCDYACGTGGCAVASAVFAGLDTNACAVLEDGTLWCWGANTDGRLDGGSTDRDQPVPILLPEPVVQVALTSHFCALLADETVACWGENHMGQLGDGTTIDRSTPQVIPQFGGIK